MHINMLFVFPSFLFLIWRLTNMMDIIIVFLAIILILKPK